jgi:hypothetical protein
MNAPPNKGKIKMELPENIVSTKISFSVEQSDSEDFLVESTNLYFETTRSGMSFSGFLERVEIIARAAGYVCPVGKLVTTVQAYDEIARAEQT